MLRVFEYDFVPNDCAPHLLAYKYQGVDRSLLYNYIFSPVANFCLHFVPYNIAPNLLTLLGFICIIVPHILFYLYFGNQLSGEVPIELLWITAILHIVYMNFDNLDGKQARRTSNSTPLGMIFDHNIDSMIVLLQGINMTTAMQFGNTFYSFYLYSIPAIPFYIVSLEEYFTNIMDLPIINPAAEGAVSVTFAFLLPALFGSNFWTQEIPQFGNIQLNQLTMIVFVIFLIVGIPLIYQNIKDKAPNRIQEAYYNTLPIIIILSLLFYSLYFSPTNIAESHMRTFMYVFGFTQSKLVGIVMLSHVAGVKLQMFKWSNFFNTLLPFLNILKYQITGQQQKIINNSRSLFIREDILISLCAIIAILSHIHFMYNCCRQMKKLLKINIFSIKKPVGQ